jgi:phosphomannomutase
VARKTEPVLAASGMPVRRVTEIDGIKFWLDDHQWVLVRDSSTEGGVRIFCETRDGLLQQRLAQVFPGALAEHI